MGDFEFNQIRVNCTTYKEEDGLVVLEGLTNNSIEVYDNNTCKYFSIEVYMESKIEELSEEIDDLRDMNTDKLLIEELRDDIDDLEDEITILKNQLRDKD